MCVYVCMCVQSSESGKFLPGFLLRDFSTEDEPTTSGINDGGWGALTGHWDEALEATRLERNSPGALEWRRMETLCLCASSPAKPRQLLRDTGVFCSQTETSCSSPSS